MDYYIVECMYTFKINDIWSSCELLLVIIDYDSDTKREHSWSNHGLTTSLNCLKLYDLHEHGKVLIYNVKYALDKDRLQVGHLHREHIVRIILTIKRKYENNKII